jgi:excisionase family DNA binding protein
MTIRPKGISKMITRQTADVCEAATLLGCSAETVRRRVRDGTIPSVKIGRKVLISRDVLHRLLAGESFKALA